MRLDMHSRQEIVKAHYREYQKAGKKERGAMLDRLVLVTGMNRDYLARVLGRYGREQAESPGKGRRKARPEGKRGGRPREYGEAFRKVLTGIWREHGRPCGKLLVVMIRGMIAFLEEAGDPGMREKLMKVSGAQADILLKPERKALEIKGISTTRAAQTPLRAHIPVRTHVDRETMEPGFFSFDTVAHCGGSASGHFCKTLTGTDPYSGWVEERALLNAANTWVKDAFEDIRSGLPFPFKGAHYDNGMEFINAPLLQWCLERHISVSRSRPYHKNDNCYAEQKNYDAVRKTVGYFRFDTVEEHAALAQVYQYLCPLYNFWYPSFKLIDKVKMPDGRYKKMYEKVPRTPYERLLESAFLSSEGKAELLRRKGLENPVELNRKLNEAVEILLRINREKIYHGNTSCQEAGQALSA